MNSNRLNSMINVLIVNPLCANPRKSSNTLKQFVGNLPTNCLSVFDHFVILAIKGLGGFGNDNFFWYQYRLAEL